MRIALLALAVLVVTISTQAYAQGSVIEGVNIDLETSIALPYDREANDSITLKFTPKAQGLEGGSGRIDHLDYNIVIEQDGEEIFNKNLHDHDGILELIIMPSDGSINVEGEAGDPPTTAPYTISGGVFNINGDYKVIVNIVGVEFNPLPQPITEEFSISVVPEFPLAAIIPMVAGFTALIVVMRMRDPF